MELHTAWGIIERSLSISPTQDVPGEEAMLEAAHVLELQELGPIIAEWFFETFRRDLQEQVAPLLWKQFEDPVTPENVVNHVASAVNTLYERVAIYSPCFERLAAMQTLLEPDVDGGHRIHVARSRDHAQMMIKAIIFYKTTRHFQDAFHEFYNRSFKCFDTMDIDDLDESSEEEEPLRCVGCEEERDRCNCSFVRESFHTVNKQLSELGLLERLSGGPVSALIHQRIRHHVDHHCKGNFETSYLSQMEQWLDTKVVGWLELIYGHGVESEISPMSQKSVLRSPSPILANPEKSCVNSSIESTPAPRSHKQTVNLTPQVTHLKQPKGMLDISSLMSGSQSGESPMPTLTPTRILDDSPVAAHKGRLYHYLYTVYADIRIDQLFNIIVEFPDSEPALVDLRVCLEKTDRRSKLVALLKKALETRLLHPGVNTADILTAYVSSIRALRVLDHTGVLLELVCEPVRKYLRSREDTVRRIVSDLTGNSGNELSEELVKGQPLVLDNSYHSEEDSSNWESWQPDPVDADPSRVSASRRSSDIISMLVNIYGSKELFVKEYCNLLADRLLTHFHSATEREIRNLELLKLRFGEQELHNCEVMLKDVADSRRINTHITDHAKKTKAPTPPAEQDENRVGPERMVVAGDENAGTSSVIPIPTVSNAPTTTSTTAVLASTTNTTAAAGTQQPQQNVATAVGPSTSQPPAPLSQPIQIQPAPTAVKPPDTIKPESPGESQDSPAPGTSSGNNSSDIPVTAMILSAQFWPPFREEKLQLPDIMQNALATYTKGYEALKGNRTLNWKNHLGLVNVEIELDDGRKLDVSVSPVHATIIYHFQTKSKWTVEELSGVMQMPASAVRRKMALWQRHGLLREESTDVFVLCEDGSSTRTNTDVIHGDVIMDDDEAESAMASASDQREEELQVLWSYIVGMLTNLESLPLERIHAMLKMFMMQSPASTEVSLPELKAYLDRQVKDQKLVYSAGSYRLPKPGS